MDFDDTDIVPTSISPSFLEAEDGIRVIFTHGYKGAFLTDPETGEVGWVKPTHLLPGAELSKNMKLSFLSDDDNAEECPKIESRLKNTGVVTDFLGIINIYTPALELCRKRWGDRFQVFHFDWRQDNTASSKEFYDLLLSLVPETSRFLIIAHSMGGMLIQGVLSMSLRACSRPDCPWNEKILGEILARSTMCFAGSPFGPCLGFLEDFTPGTKMHLEYIPCEQIITFPSSFQLCFFGKNATIPELYDPEFWDKRGIGVFGRKDLSKEEREKYKSAMKPLIARAIKFHEEFLVPSFEGTMFEGVSTFVVTSKSHATSDGIPPHFTDLDRPIEWEHINKLQGDNRTPYEMAINVPKGLDLELILVTEREHQNLLTNPELMDRLFDEFLAVPKNKRMGVYPRKAEPIYIPKDQKFFEEQIFT